MPKLFGWPGQAKHPSFKKGLVFRVNQGSLFAQMWPRKRGKPTHPVTKEQNAWFREANLLAKYASGGQQWIAIRITKNGPWYPRDLLMSAMAGRLFERLEIDGQTWFSVAVREDISENLDIVAGKIEGTILVRDAEVWRGLVPGLLGQVLASGGPSALPAWGPGGVAAGLIFDQNMPSVGFSGAPFASKGYLFVASRAFTMHGSGTNVNATSGHTYRATLAKVSGANAITSIEAQSAPFVAGAGGSTWLQGLFTAPAVLVSGQRYFVGWSRTDGAAAFALPLRGAVLPGVWLSMPVEHFNFNASASTAGRLAKAVLAVGDTFTINTAGMFIQTPILSI